MEFYILDVKLIFRTKPKMDESKPLNGEHHINQIKSTVSIKKLLVEFFRKTLI